MAVDRELLEIVGRARRIGWPVEQGDAGQEWRYRITCPNGFRVQLHSTPSDTNWKKHIMLKLNRHGFAAAEKEWLANDERERAEKIVKDRTAAERKAAAVAKKAAAANAALVKAAGNRAIHEPDIVWLTTPVDVPETKVMRITPVVAQKLLDTINTNNRPVRPSHVDYLTRIIRDGDWSLTHQGGAVDWNGVLQDGQHRLLAIVEADESVVMQWTVGLDPANFAKVDVGSQRTGRDVAMMRGIKHATIAPSVARMLLQIDMYGPEAHTRNNKTKISVDRVHRALEDYGDELLASITRAVKLRGEIKVNATGLAAAIYMIRRRLPEGDPRVEKFFDDIETGIGLDDKSDPVWLLRRFIIRSNDAHLGGGAKRGLRAFDIAAYVLKAWNLRMAGRTVTAIVWRNNEPFPATVFLPPPIAPTFSDLEEVEAS